MNPSIGNLVRWETTISVMLQDNYMLSQKMWLLIYQQTSKFSESLPFGQFKLLMIEWADRWIRYHRVSL